MRSGRFCRGIAVFTMLALPVLAHAQEATLSGTVADSTGGALPGVTVIAVHTASGNSFEAVTDERGDFRIPARIGAYTLTADLPGFTSATRDVTLLVGQTAVLELTMAVGGVQETVTVTGEAPLLDVTTSSMGGNIDSRQLEELPVNGRNWVDLVMLAPGARVNHVSEAPTNDGLAGSSTSRRGGNYELNVDGQQVTTLVTGTTDAFQPRFSRDTMAEFEFLSSRFDATQGRSSGMQVNAVTKSGTNSPSGSFAGYFRDSKFQSADHVAGRVLDYENQQLVGTFGGPIRQDRIHIFGHYEYEAEPQTLIYTTPYPSFNTDLSGNRTERKAGVRLDAQFTSQMRLTGRWTMWRDFEPGGGGDDTVPSLAADSEYRSDQYFGTLTNVLSSSAVNELKVGFSGYDGRDTDPKDRDPAVFNPNFRLLEGAAPNILLRGLSLGVGAQLLDHQTQNVYSIRDDVTLTFNKGGRHTVKLGAEYLDFVIKDVRCNRCEGELLADNGPIPDNIEALFPDLFDATTWDLDALSPLTVRWRQNFQTQLNSSIPRNSTGVWIQDDWNIKPRLTLNFGLRYDFELNAFANDLTILPVLDGNQPNDFNNFGPRAGFSFAADDRTVYRGGYGLYFGTVQNNHFGKFFAQTITLNIPSDGRADFASNPWNGPDPTFAEVKANTCTAALEPGCLRKEVPTGGAVWNNQMVIPYAHQGSVGMQRQIGDVFAVEVDYVYSGSRGAPRDLPLNLSFDPETGTNYPFSDIERRPIPWVGYVSLTHNGHRSNYHALQTGFTKRFRDRWQGSATYTLSTLKDAFPLPRTWDPATQQSQLVPFPVAIDYGGEYAKAVTDQTHRAVLNGIWEGPGGIQLSGLYFYGSGERQYSNYGTDLRNIGSRRPNTRRLRPDGTIVERNNWIANSIHRVDVRAQYRIPLGPRVGVDAIVEVFNALDHANFGRWNTSENSSRYRTPRQFVNSSYFPRTAQLGFRLTF